MVNPKEMDMLHQERYRKVLKMVFVLHIIMFVVSITAAAISQSSSVLADALDFIGDAANYAISLFILTSSILIRAGISIAKAVTMIVFGIPVLVYSIMRIQSGELPDYEVMNIAGILGIITHLVCIYLLFPYRSGGDSNQLSVWICTINDLISNILTVFAAYMVGKTNSIMPDIISASIIVSISFIGALIILKQALYEIKMYKKQNQYAQANT